MQIKNYNVYFFILILSGITVLAFFLIKPFLTAILVAGILAVTFHRPYKFFLRKTKNKVTLSASLTSIIILLLIVVPLFFVFGLLLNEANNTYHKITSEEDAYKNQVRAIVETVDEFPLIEFVDLNKVLSPEQLSDSLRNLSRGFLGLFQKTYQNIASFTILTFVMFFTLYYLLIEGERLIKKIMYYSPLQDKHEDILVGKFVSMTRATLKGTIIVGLVQGLLSWITFVIAGIPSAAIWGVIMIIISIIPAIGPAVILFPAGIIMLFLGNIWQGVFILVMGLGIISTIDNILRPNLVGRDTQMHPILVFFATLGGIIVFGLVGFIIGPIIMALFLALWEIYGKEFKGQLNKYNHS